MSLAVCKQVLTWCAVLAGWLLVGAILGLSASSASAAELRPLERPMEFLLVHGDKEYCRSDGTCADWIAAEGRIYADSPARFQKLLKRLGNKKLPIIIRSPGGDVAAAMQLGTIIRKKGLSVAVGGTQANGCPDADPLCKDAIQKDGSVKGQAYGRGGVCLSACPLVLAGGVRRVAGLFTAVGVHQITTTYRETRVQYRTEYETLNGRRKILSRQEVGRKVVGQRNSTKLNAREKSALIAYFNKMGIDPSLFDLMMSATPDTIRILTQAESLQLHMTSEYSAAYFLIMAGACPAGQSLESCLPHPAAAPPPPVTPSPVSPPSVTPPSATPPAAPLPDSPEPGMPQPLEQQAGLPMGRHVGEVLRAG